MAASVEKTGSNGTALTASEHSGGQNAAQNQLAPISAGNRGLMLHNMDELWRFAGAVTKAKMAPKTLDSTEKVFIALQMGAEVGLSPMQSLKNIAVIHNSPSMWGDALVALVRRSPACEWIKETWTGDGEKRKAIVIGKRRGDPQECTREFGYADAKRAGLLANATYKNYPDRMYQNRARAWMFRDLFADLLMGLDIAEEMQDLEYTQSKPSITSGDDAPLNTLDDATELLGRDDVSEAEFTQSPSEPTAEELADWEREKAEAAGQTTTLF